MASPPIIPFLLPSVEPLLYYGSVHVKLAIRHACKNDTVPENSSTQPLVICESQILAQRRRQCKHLLIHPPLSSINFPSSSVRFPTPLSLLVLLICGSVSNNPCPTATAEGCSPFSRCSTPSSPLYPIPHHFLYACE
jgi:hypothetical protein